MSINGKLLALTLLKDADDDVLSRDSSNPDRIIYYKVTPESERLKVNALVFFFSRESEPDLDFWCDLAELSKEEFRHKYRDIKDSEEYR